MFYINIVAFVLLSIYGLSRIGVHLGRYRHQKTLDRYTQHEHEPEFFLSGWVCFMLGAVGLLIPFRESYYYSLFPFAGLVVGCVLYVGWVTWVEELWPAIRAAPVKFYSFVINGLKQLRRAR